MKKFFTTMVVIGIVNFTNSLVWALGWTKPPDGSWSDVVALGIIAIVFVAAYFVWSYFFDKDAP